MKRIINITWKLLMVALVGILVLVAVKVYPKRDELVTKHITTEYFLEIMNSNNQEAVRNFVADGNGDQFYINFIGQLNNIYYYEGVESLSYKITDMEIIGDGKHQGYLSGPLENYKVIWDEENEGRYINYLINAEVQYTYKGELKERKEKGLLVFVKDMSEGNYFTWKFVRLNRYIPN